ncbi:hypothetical protein Sta7437_0831 [Stanieria cyanosphaera PCC 7437]|uniref:Low temperature-induced protein n=1 Tax=Stanieria cyanosphaera (strain ATCC 29371 / PCC 7437) TaxID=111780 RepID=K9XQQ3_STAC7|nr:hypothetical protein [Stanieria cyanosphaera]AFZ34419.1 hypothetical protein Sta7437_0831 [Stanieria cyanosphaera PCC 7437]
MLSINFKSIFHNSVRFLLTAMVCCLLFVANVFPAYAVTSSPTEGEANLNRIQDKTDEIARSKPLNLEETIEANKGGLNEVQGAADEQKMVEPGETNATSVTEQAKKFFTDLTK